ncbi:MAG TPA: DUF1116 domain-containing protein, partial [Candidatus Cloacimonadota bacterium]|nr:DUF1116 domain-containing protein [Candidatus Cloacimonadota bacterium]
MTKLNLNSGKLKVLNLGLESFAQNIVLAGHEALHLAWEPPFDIPSELVASIRSSLSVIEQANQKALDIIQAGKPVLVGMGIAGELIPGMHQNLILHAGPPITWQRMCGPMRGAIIGALIYEGRADSPEAAEKLASGGEIEYAPCHEHCAIGPMAGIISPRMPVFIIKNE